MTFKMYGFSFLVSLLLGCHAQDNEKIEKPEVTHHQADQVENPMQIYYQKNKGNDKPSVSKGTVSNGSLQNGKLIPYQGKNFAYFDSKSYLQGRGYLNNRVLDVILASYEELDTMHPGRKFFIMESANKNGGKLHPHRTHQNGLSVDLMMPKLKNGKPNYTLDTLGANHYFLDFDEQGRFKKDKSIVIDFQLIVDHLLILQDLAAQHQMKISKVIIHTDYKGEIYSCANSEELKEKGIYIVRKLSPLINSLHDDHYHVDFELL